MPVNVGAADYEIDALGYVKDAVVNASEFYSLAESDKWPIINTVTTTNTGTVATATAAMAQAVVIALDADTFAAVYVDPDDTNDMRYVVAERAAGSALNALASGVLLAGSSAITQIKAVKVSATEIALAWNEATPAVKSATAVWNSGGPSLTLGTQRTVDNTASTGAQLDITYNATSDKVAVGYFVGGATDTFYIKTAAFTGTNLDTFSSAATLGATGGSTGGEVLSLGNVPETSLVVAVWRWTGGTDAKAASINVSASTPVRGTIRSFSSGGAPDLPMVIEGLSSTTVVSILELVGNLNYAVFSVSAGELQASPTEGTLLDATNNLEMASPRLERISDTRGFFIAQDAVDDDLIGIVAEFTGTPSVEQQNDINTVATGTSSTSASWCSLIDSLNAVTVCRDTAANDDLRMDVVQFRSS